MGKNKLTYQTKFRYITNCQLDLNTKGNLIQYKNIIDFLYNNKNKKNQLKIPYNNYPCDIYINYNKQAITYLKQLINYCEKKYNNIFNFFLIIKNKKEITLSLIHFIKEKNIQIYLLLNPIDLKLYLHQNIILKKLFEDCPNLINIKLKIKNKKDAEKIYFYYLFLNNIKINSFSLNLNYIRKIEFSQVMTILNNNLLKIFSYKINKILNNQLSLYMIEIDKFISFCILSQEDLLSILKMYNNRIIEGEIDYLGNIYFNKIYIGNIFKNQVEILKQKEAIFTTYDSMSVINNKINNTLISKLQENKYFNNFKFNLSNILTFFEISYLEMMSFIIKNQNLFINTYIYNLLLNYELKENFVIYDY